MSPSLESLVEPIIYGDVFDFPLTLEELHRFCTQALSREELSQEIRDNPAFDRIVSCQEGLYCLRGREQLIALRQDRRPVLQGAWKLALRIVAVLRYAPFVRGIFVTGSLAVDNARKRDDLDFMVVTEKGRLWSVFFVLGVLQRLSPRRILCPNFYLTVDHLRLRRESLYVAREATQARPVFGHETCQRFYTENRWIFELFPNAAEMNGHFALVQERRGLFGFGARCLEWVLGGRLGDAVENLLKKTLKHRLSSHYGKHAQDVPAPVLQNALDEVELRFHGLNHESMIYREIESRKAQLGSLLHPGSGHREHQS